MVRQETVQIARASLPFAPGGLGLSQVYGLVKQSGGHIKIYSEVGSGTAIKMYFPRAFAVAANEQPQRPPRPASAQPRSETILVVEDNDLLLESVSAMLREHGYRVLTALNGVEALARLEVEKSVDLLFTDVGLPGGIDGRRLAEAVRQRRPGLIVLFTTGYTRNAIIHHGRLDPDVEFISKPFTYAALVAKIERLFTARADS